jgi:hypothetical protein
MWILSECWCLTPIILATQEAEISRIMVWNQPRQMACEHLSWKYPMQKRDGSVAQVVEYLSCKHEAQSSNSSTTRKKKVTITIIFMLF